MARFMNCKFILIYIFKCCCRLSRWCPLWRHETNESTSSHLKGERPTSTSPSPAPSLTEADHITQGNQIELDSPTPSAPTPPTHSFNGKATAITRGLVYDVVAASLFIIILMAVVYRPKCQSQPEQLAARTNKGMKEIKEWI